MATGEILQKAREGWTDEEVVERVLNGETALYEIILRRYNQRLYRVARAIVRNDAEAEDVMQDAYVRAYQNLRQFEGRSPFSAWLTKIAVHEALARLRQRRKFDQLDSGSEEGDFVVEPATQAPDPETATSAAEITRLLEQTLLTLPEQYRAVLMLRDIEEMSTADTAAVLDLTEENVKVRLHRGRAMLRRELVERMGASTKGVFAFMGERCDRVVRNVLAAINA
jgi:RNA polymerase sigma-70 factor, ECF subfamily